MWFRVHDPPMRGDFTSPIWQQFVWEEAQEIVKRLYLKLRLSDIQ